MQENWGKEGMPPLYYDVLDRWVVPRSEDGEIRTEWIWIKGEHPHLGKVIRRNTGTETFVELYVNDGYERIRRDFYNLPEDHPLYNLQNNKSKSNGA